MRTCIQNIVTRCFQRKESNKTIRYIAFKLILLLPHLTSLYKSTKVVAELLVKKEKSEAMKNLMNEKEIHTLAKSIIAENNSKTK